MTLKQTTDRDDKVRFSVTQLSDEFQIARKTVDKRIEGITPVGRKGKSDLWRLRDVCTLIDVRDPYIPPKKVEPERAVYDPEQMNPQEKLNHFRAEDAKQGAIAKQRKNAVESRLLIPANEVERALAEGFKKVALTLDSLPDALERDGIVSSTDIEKIIALIDRSRGQLAQDLSELSPSVLEIEARGDW